MSQARYLIGDVFDRLAELQDRSVDLILTSPPFLALRSYLPADHPDKAKEIGSEPTPAAFLDTLLALTAEWRRVLAPHGSICVELGDTYSGSGGGGGDYLPGGLRENQPGFGGSAERAREGNAAHWRQKNAQKNAWPLDKSLCGIPHLYHLSLTYGRNLLTGEPSPAGQWRVRNVVAWCRPNPPVGALGDKFRAATSYMTIACVSRQRYFDLDSVRQPPGPPGGSAKPGERKVTGARQDDGQPHQSNNHPAGAPPLDWWEIPTQPYSGSHYATWPEALLVRPIKAMCPQQVCRVCGKPSERIVEVERHGAQDNTAGRNGRKVSDLDRKATTLGWTDCGCQWPVLQDREGPGSSQPRTGEPASHLGSTPGPSPRWRNGIVLDPFAGSGTTLAVAVGHGRDAIGIDLDQRNAQLARERVGMFLEVDDDPNPRPVVDVHPSEGVA